jgi:hypothetical protein
VLLAKSKVIPATSAVSAPSFDINLSGGDINLGDVLFVGSRVIDPPRLALCE